MVTIALGRHDGRIHTLDEAPGDITIVRSRRVEDALELVEGLASEDASLLSITRAFPDKLNLPVSFGSVDYYWLTNMVGERRISPSSLGRIVSIVKSAADGAKKTVIFLEGIEYLVLENDFNAVLKALNQVCDIAVNSESKVFISVDPVALNQKEIAMMERTSGAKVVEADYEPF